MDTVSLFFLFVREQKGAHRTSRLEDATYEVVTLAQTRGVCNCLSRKGLLYKDRKGGRMEVEPSLEATSDSFVVLIEQALQAGDASLLDQCLKCSDENIIETTIRNLPPNRVIGFLNILILKLEKRPSHGLIVMTWLERLLRTHTTLLMSTPSLVSQVSNLSQILEQRVATYSQLSSLKGRLDLVMSHVSFGGSSGEGSSSSMTAESVWREEEE